MFVSDNDVTKCSSSERLKIGKGELIYAHGVNAIILQEQVCCYNLEM